jgi:hypothetical protein
MRIIRLAVALLAAVVALSACQSNDNADKTSDRASQASYTMPDVTGIKLDKAYERIKDAGFENKDNVKLDGGGTFGVVVESNWTVCSQTPAAGTQGTDAPELKIDRSCNDGTTPTDEPTDTTSTPTTPQEPAVLTVMNSPELKALLALDDNCSGKVKQFAKKHAGDTIKFDGSIQAEQPHGSYQTRFDFLIGAGNFDPNKAMGPTFQFNNMNYYDLQLAGKHVPDSVRVGQNYTFTARLGDYDATNCLYQLQPVETRTR